jgi:hypothetical protein
LSRKRKIILVLFIVCGALSMWARHSYEQQKRRRMEETLRRLSMHNQPGLGLLPTPEPTPDDRVEEPRDMFDSTLPQELLEQLTQKVGKDFKLMEVYVSERSLQANVSTDGATVQRYERPKDRKTVEGPAEVKLIGDGKLEDNLFDPRLVDLSLLPRLAKEAAERAAIPGGKAESARFNYPSIRYKGQGPEWSLIVWGGEGEARQHKFVVFDAKGKFKQVF